MSLIQGTPFGGVLLIVFKRFNEGRESVRDGRSKEVSIPELIGQTGYGV